jgi:hypothetical protein
MKKITVNDFISSLDIKTPEKEKFWKLGDLTSLWKDDMGNFWRLNYERGPLLYALIAKLRPTNVIEFGTGNGFSTLCMAWAMSDYDIDGKIFTVDRFTPDISFEVSVNHDEDFSPRIELLSLNELWSKAAHSDWLKHIEIVSGYSGEVMNKTQFPKIQFAYIDGAHHYEAVKHDFYSTLGVIDEKFGILFDDCMERSHYGVKEFIENEIDKNFDAMLIDTDVERNFEKLKIPTNPEYGMCWIHSDTLKGSLKDLYPESSYLKFLKKYRKYELIRKRREKLNTKIPFLTKVKFRWWSK